MEKNLQQSTPKVETNSITEIINDIELKLENICKKLKITTPELAEINTHVYSSLAEVSNKLNCINNILYYIAESLIVL